MGPDTSFGARYTRMNGFLQPPRPHAAATRTAMKKTGRRRKFMSRAAALMDARARSEYLFGRRDNPTAIRPLGLVTQATTFRKPSRPGQFSLRIARTKCRAQRPARRDA